MRRRVRHHRQRVVLHDIRGERTRAGAHDLRRGIAIVERGGRDGVEPALVRVHRAGQHAGERDRHLVRRRAAGVVVELVVFGAAHRFARQHVGPGAAFAGRFRSAVQHDRQVMVGRLARDFVGERDHVLVVAVHEIDHHAGHAPFFPLGERRINLRAQRHPVAPDPQTHAAPAGTGQDFVHVDFGASARQILGGAVGLDRAGVPCLILEAIERVEEDAVIGIEIDIGVHRGGVQARREGLPRPDIVVPPRKAGLARRDP